jgi:hypothetical protein
MHHELNVVVFNILHCSIQYIAVTGTHPEEQQAGLGYSSKKYISTLHICYHKCPVKQVPYIFCATQVAVHMCCTVLVLEEWG